jgi:hypothetical protein
MPCYPPFNYARKIFSADTKGLFNYHVESISAPAPTMPPFYGTRLIHSIAAFHSIMPPTYGRRSFQPNKHFLLRAGPPFRRR